MAGDANPVAAAPPNTCICCGVHLTCSNSACSLAAEARAAEGGGMSTHDTGAIAAAGPQELR